MIEPIQLTEKARIPQNDPAYQSVEVFKDRLVLHYKRAPTIALAAGHVIAGGDEVGYLRRIVSVSATNATTLELKTETATLGELIFKGHFRVTQEPAASGWENAGGDINSRCYPLGENSYSLFKEGDDLPCKVAAGRTLKLTPELVLTPKLIFEVDFDPGYLLVDGELVYAKFALEGSLDAGAEVETKGELTATCEADVINWLRDKSDNDQLFKSWLPAIKFAIGPVPVVISHYLEPIFKATLQAKLNGVNVTGSGKVHLGVGAGVEYANGKWAPLWKTERSGKLDFSFGDDTFEFSLSSGLSVGVAYTALIYSTAGPKLGLVLGATLTGTVAPLTCKWKADLTGGVDLEYGAELQVPVLDKKIWDVSGKVSLYSTKILETEGPLLSSCKDGGVDAGRADAKPDAPKPDSAKSDLPGPDASRDGPVVDGGSCASKWPVGPFTGVTVETFTDRASFEQRLAGCTRNVDFDDVSTAATGEVAFAATRYVSKGIVITGQGGQYASQGFKYPSEFVAVSKPNMYAPGPISTTTGGGHSSTVTFSAGGKPAAVAGFGAVFIDADYPSLGQSSLSVLGKTGGQLGSSPVSGANASQVFRGIVTVDASKNPVPAIFSVTLVNGNEWPPVGVSEGVTLDDFVFADPVAW